MIEKLTYLRAFGRIVLLIVGTVILMPFQLVWTVPSILLHHLQRYQSPIATLWFKYVLCIFGINVSVINKRNLSRRQKIYLSNHISYIDILIMGAHFNGFFIAKSDIASWPIFGFLSKITGTLFIKRNRRYLQVQIELLKKHLNAKQSLIIFPEGTTGNGHELLHFKSGLLNVLDEVKKKPVLQPLSIRYTQIDKKPLATQGDFDRVAWYGDMVLAPHLWQLLRNKSLSARVVIHPILQIPEDSTPKSLMAKVEAEIRTDFL
jgi:1-acyl-sn-glycerol-3-phosphate acyltransferase